jgi:hypothetical protein
MFASLDRIPKHSAKQTKATRKTVDGSERVLFFLCLLMMEGERILFILKDSVVGLAFIQIDNFRCPSFSLLSSFPSLLTFATLHFCWHIRRFSVPVAGFLFSVYFAIEFALPVVWVWCDVLLRTLNFPSFFCSDSIRRSRCIVSLGLVQRHLRAAKGKQASP